MWLVNSVALFEFGEEAFVDCLGLGDDQVGYGLSNDNSCENSDVESHNTKHNESTESGHQHVDQRQFDSELEWLHDGDLLFMSLMGTISSKVS